MVDRKENQPRRRQDNSGGGDEREEPLTPYEVDMDEEEQIDSTQESPTGFWMVDTEIEDDEEALLDSEEMDDFISVGTNPDAVMDGIDDYTDDEDTLDDFSERQGFTSGSDELLQRLQQHHSKKPELSAGDLDAQWDRSDQSGEEAVGGTTPTPDQDIVEELGEAVGIEYEYDEPLHTYDKLRDRDINRWELDPESADDADEEDDLDEEDFDEGRDEI